MWLFSKFDFSAQSILPMTSGFWYYLTQVLISGDSSEKNTLVHQQEAHQPTEALGTALPLISLE